MKKSILTFALFSLVVLTSFTTLNSPAETGDDDPGNGTPTTTTTTDTNRTIDTGGNQNIPPIKKFTDPAPFAPVYPNQEIPQRRK